MSSGPLFLRLGVPTGMEDLLEGLAREVLRHQPKDIYKFAAVHFEGLLLQRQTTQSAALTVSTRAENQEGQTEKAKAVAAEDVPPVRPPRSPTSDSGKASATSSPPVSPSRSPQQIKPVRTKLTNIGEKLPSPILQQAMTKAFTEESEPESSVNSGATASEDKILGRDVVSSPDTSSKVESAGFGFAKGLVASPVKDLLSEGSRSVSSGLSSVASRAEQMESDLKRRADSAKSDATSKISSARSDIESKATEVQSRIEEAKTGLGAMVTEAEDRVTEAKGGIEQAAADAEAKLAEAKADVESKAAELEEKASAAIKEAAEEAEQRVSAVREGVESKIEEAESKVGEVRAQVESAAAEAESKIEQVKADVESKVAEAESKIDEAKHEIEAKVEEVKSEFETKANEIKSEAQKVASEVESKVEEVKSEAEKKINHIRAEAESAATELQSKIEESKEEADKKVAEIQSEAAGVVSNVEATIEEVQSEAVKKVEEIKSEAESVVVEAESQIDAAQAEVKNIVSEVESQVESAKSDVETKINEAVVEIKSEAESVVAQAEDKVTEAEKQVAETVAQVESQVDNVKSEVEQKISDAMTEFDQLKSQAEETTAEIQQEAEQVVSSVSIKITEAQNEIENEIEEKVNIVENEFTSVVDKAEDFATQAESEIKSQVAEVEAAVTEAVSENIASAEEKISQTVSEVKSELETDFGALKETAEDITELSKNIANEGEAKIVKFQEELNPDAITAALKEKQQEISEELSDLATGAATALKENIEEVKAAIEQTEAEKEEEMRLVEKNALEVIENVIAEAESKLEAAAAESLELTEDVSQQLEENLQTQIDNASEEVAAIEAEVSSKAEALVDFAESAKSEVEEKASAIVGVLDELEETKAEAQNALVELEEAAETQIEAIQETQEQALEEASVIVSELIEDIEEKQSQAVEDASEIVSDVADAVQEVALDPVLEEVENAIAKIEQETPVVLSPEFPSTADEVSTTISNDETPVEEILQNESSILIEEAAIEAAQLSPRSVTSEAIDAPADLLDSEPSSPRSAKPTGLLLPVATIDITPATPLPSPSNEEEEGGIFDKVTFDADALIESTQNALNNNEDKIEEIGVAAATERAILIESAASELAQDEEEEPSESQSSTGIGNEAVGAVSRVVIRSSISEGVKGQQQSAGEEAGESEAEQQAFSPVQEDKEIADTLIAGVGNSESSEDLTVTASEPAEVLSERTASSRDVPSLEMDDSKKTVTVDPIDLTALRGSSSPSSPEKQQAPLLQQIEEESSVETSSQHLQEQLVDEDAGLPEQLEQAATKIQASFRGYKTRKALGDKVDDASAEKNSMPLQEEFHTLPEMIMNESVVHENVETPAAGGAADETSDCAGDEIACVMDPELLKDRPDSAPRSEQNSPPPRSPINEPEETQIESLEPEICGVVDSDAVAPADQQQPKIILETPAEENSVELVNENVSPPIEPQSDAVLEISPEPKIETADSAADAVLIDSESSAAVNASDAPVEEKIEGTPLEPEIIIFAPSEPLDGVSESDHAEIDQLGNAKTDEISVPVESAPADVSDAATSETLELEAAATTANESGEILTGENSESPIKIFEEIQDNLINLDDTGVAEIGDSIIEVVNNTPALAEEANIKEDEINSEGPKTVDENNDLVEISEIPNTDDDTIIVEAMDASETVGVESLIPNLENINVEVESNIETIAPISAEAINELANTTDNGENNQSENTPIMEERIVITTIENDDDTVIVEAIELVSETVRIEDSEQNAIVNEFNVDESEPQIVALDVEQVDIPQAEINTEEDNPSLNNLINFDQDDAQAIATDSKETEHLGTEMESVINEDDTQANDESGIIEVAPVDGNNTLIEGSSNETKEAVVVSEPVDILGSVIHSPEMNLTPDNYKIDPEIVSDILAEEVEAAHLMGLLTPRLDENDAPEPKTDSPLVPNEEIFPMEIEDPAEPDAAISAVEMTDEAKAHDAQTRAINDGETAQNADENLSSGGADAANLIEISKEPDEAEAVKSQTEEKSSTEPLRGVSAADTISPQSRMGSSLEPEAPSTPVSALEELFISSTHLAATPIAFLPDERASPLSQEELQAAHVQTSQVSRNLSCSSGECADVSASLTDEPPAEAPPAPTTQQDALVSDEATPSRRTLRREDALASEAGGDADAPGAAVRHSGEFHDSLVLPPALLAGAGVRPDAQPEAAGRDDRLDQQPADEMSFLDRAATRIQATFLGFRARSELKPKIEEPPPATKADHDAAAKIQAGFRGYKVRKEMKERSLGSQQTSPTHDEEEKSAVKIQAGVRGFLTRQRLKHDKEALPARPRPPPPDPDQDDVNDAVVKIQAGFRGYKARQEVKKIRQNN